MLCNYLQNVAAITYIFVLQLSTFLFYNKHDKHWLCSALIQVLIETLWNVKRTTLYFPASDRLVLIETLWNVKINRNIYCRISVISFNRNIVECKVLNELKISTGSIGFNRNIVECKVSRTGRNFVSVS